MADACCGPAAGQRPRPRPPPMAAAAAVAGLLWQAGGAATPKQQLPTAMQVGASTAVSVGPLTFYHVCSAVAVPSSK